MILRILTIFAALMAVSGAARAADNWPPATEHDFIIHDFRFASGETLPQLRIHYRTLGTPRRDASGRIVNAVMVLHGTGGDGTTFLRPIFAGVLFSPGGLLDASKDFIILPDGIGHGGSSKPSDGLRMRFPKYAYDDMVRAEHALVTEGLGVQRLRLLMGTSMGCMHAFMWGERWPEAVQALMPLACLPVQIAGRNRTWRKMIIDLIENDPAWQGGEYRSPPLEGLRGAQSLLAIAGSAPLPNQLAYPTRDQADAALEKRMAAAITSADANDLIYAVSASRDYDPSRDLERITVPVTWVNSGDDFINPPELGIAEREVKRMPDARFVLIPAGPDTYGHGTHTVASLWKDRLAELLQRSEGR